MVIANEKVLFIVFWISLMLIYLLGDVLRIFAGDFVGGEIDGSPMSQSMWFMVAVIMVIPIVMIVLNLLLPLHFMKWPNIVVAVGFFLFNIAGIAGYKPYDQFLLVISFVVNFLTVYYAWML
ncbi:hypothetical protein KQ51_00093 [Candidatus Izimaplasma bacterium HR1]|jgi:hypothetical protein|uniref:DUF6326 family protein n=1 Tax=Candidatus Izimoplasma sp. HR1 TaxID=1541959 RepID=UPI0004F7C7E7|nr:hypothetical protein KQ51_00093 [Candidatus Izimaplasma bacterium HR1]